MHKTHIAADAPADWRDDTPVEQPAATAAPMNDHANND